MHGLERGWLDKHSTARTDQIDDLSDLSTVDHLVPHLPLWEVMQDLHGTTDPTQETRAVVEDAGYTGPTHPPT